MSGVEWERVRILFQAALEQPEGTRDLFLSAACKDDEHLGRELRSLLAAHAAAGKFLETPAVRVEGRPETGPPLALQPGDRVGTFEVLAPLGAGGMGEVYRARDSRLGRDVAIKLLPPHSPRILASLNQPNIAAIHSIEHIDGLRLPVLELVEGPTLADRLRSGRCRCQTRSPLRDSSLTPSKGRTSAASCIATSSRRT
jgi:eukaryotic-like serine/threonine-protein kinase